MTCHRKINYQYTADGLMTVNSGNKQQFMVSQ